MVFCGQEFARIVKGSARSGNTNTNTNTGGPEIPGTGLVCLVAREPRRELRTLNLFHTADPQPGLGHDS